MCGGNHSSLPHRFGKPVCPLVGVPESGLLLRILLRQHCSRISDPALLLNIVVMARLVAVVASALGVFLLHVDARQ